MSVSNSIKQKILNDRGILILYFVVCMVVALPFNNAIFNLLFLEPLPAGIDSSNHGFFVKRIIDTGNPLIDYVNFPDQNTTRYYPSFFHVILSGATVTLEKISPDIDPVLTSMKYMMFAVGIGGILGYSLLIKTVLDASLYNKYKNMLSSQHANDLYRLTYLILLVLSFGIFIFSVTPILKSYNDALYPEIFCMWLVFPFYMVSILKKRLYLAGMLLAVITSTHNLSIVMSIIATISYFGMLALSRDFVVLRKTWKLLVTFVPLSIPAILVFYIPTISAMANSEAGDLSSSWSRLEVANQLKPLLFYLGIAAIVGLVVVNYKELSWLIIWTVLYFVVFDISEIFGARFGREISIPLGIALGILVSYILHWILVLKMFRVSKSNHKDKFLIMTKMRLAIALIAVFLILPLYYTYFDDRFKAEGNPILTRFYSDAIETANAYLTQSSVNVTHQNVENPENLAEKGAVVVFGHNPWLKYESYGRYSVYEVYSEDLSNWMSENDKQINDDLRTILEFPNSVQAKCVLQGYNVQYVFISDLLPDRFYTPYQLNAEYSQLENFLNVSDSQFVHLDRTFSGSEGEKVRVFAVDKGHKYDNSQCG